MFDLPEAAESIAFWHSLDDDEFARYTLEVMGHIIIDGTWHPIADYFDAESLKSVWQESGEIVDKWLGQDYSDHIRNAFTYWMAMGFVGGYIAKATGE